MKIAIMAGLSAKGDMYIDACHWFEGCRFVWLHIHLKYRLLILASALVFFAHGQNKHVLQWTCIDKGTTAFAGKIALQTDFSNKTDCAQYLQKELSGSLFRMGYLAFSIDSIVQTDSRTQAWFYLGDQYHFGRIRVGENILSEVFQNGKAGLNEGEPIDPLRLSSYTSSILHYYENNGYPFASVRLDSSYLRDAALYAILKVEKGPLYHIDSIHVEGNLHISHDYLENLLDIKTRSIYNQSSLEDISKRLASTGFLLEKSPWNLTLLGTGAVLNLFLEQRRGDQIDLLAGLMPSNTQLGGKMLLTGEANMQLNNAFGGGEHVLVNWQQLQVQSPRLQMGFQKPFLFKTQSGIDMQFNLLKKDSTYMNINTRLGWQYFISGRTKASIFFQQFSSSLLDIDTSLIKSTKRLPAMLDVSNSQFGISYHHVGTDNTLNPRKGFELEMRLSAGLRKIARNQTIVMLEKDALGKPFNFGSLYDTVKAKSSQGRAIVKFDQFFPVGTQSTMKFGLNGGYIMADRIYRNELFQIGGIKTLRGVNEESLFASGYLISNLEYRYLLGTSSYLYAFFDAAKVQRKSLELETSGTYLGTGLGLSFETKSGMFNLAYAIGKQPSSGWGFKEAKIHFGFVAIF